MTTGHAPGAADVVLVRTEGTGSLDAYSQRLAEHLAVRCVTTDAYHRCASSFGAPLLGRRAARVLATDVALIHRLRALRAAVHLPSHHMARYGPFLRMPYVVTVHDVIRFLDVRAHGDPMIHRPNLRDRLYLRLDAIGIRRAAAVIAVSEHTRRDLVEHLGVARGRVHVVPEGVDMRRFRAVGRRPAIDPYVLFVGSEHPRKNLDALLRAFADLKPDPRFADLRLVKVGAAGGREAPFRERTLATIRALGIEADVHLVGRVSHTELLSWYSGARCLVLPSRYEGFGLPVLEAMACGCPAVVSSATSLPEVAGEAALVFGRPDDVPSLARAIASVADPQAERRRRALRRLGLARAAALSWHATAERTLAVYAEVAAAMAERAAPATATAIPASETGAAVG